MITAVATSKKSQSGLKKDHETVQKYNKTASASTLSGKLEKHQKEREQRAMWKALGLAISLAFVTLAFQWRTADESDLLDLGALDADFEELQDIPLTIQTPPPPPQQLQQPEIIEVPDEEEIEEELDINLDVEVTEETAIEEVVFEEAPEEETSDEVFLIVEETATPVGGMTKFYQYFGKNLVYPIPARQAGIEGKVYLQFIVDKNGNVSDVKVAKGIGYGCDEEAIRVIKEGPKWNPAKQRGKAVNSRVTFPLHFKLS